MICAIERLVSIALLLVNDLAAVYQARCRNIPSRPDWNHFRVSSSHRASLGSASGHVRHLNRTRLLLAGSSRIWASTHGQSPTNGSSRVRCVRGFFIWLGNVPACSYLRAVRSLTPARAAANFWLNPLPRSFSSNWISPSFFMPAP
jgi:hypothetical protein